MAFVVGKVETVKRRVQFNLPADDGKRPEKADFSVTLKVRDIETIKTRMRETQDKLIQIQREITKLTKDPEYEADLPEEDFKEEYLREDITDLEGCQDENGKDLEFSEELLSAVLLDRDARRGLIKVWDELNLEPQAAKRKN